MKGTGAVRNSESTLETNLNGNQLKLYLKAGGQALVMCYKCVLIRYKTLTDDEAGGQQGAAGAGPLSVGP